jgi:SSS family solute:Na+ symporter
MINKTRKDKLLIWTVSQPKGTVNSIPMKCRNVIFLSVAAILFLTGCNETEELTNEEVITWGALPDLPNTKGLSGAFSGLSNGALIVAGGAIFSEYPGRDEGKENWQDAISVLQGDQDAAWISDFVLNKPLAYGASASTGKSLILIGGKNADGYQSEVSELTWDPATKNINKENLPSLPYALAYSGAAINSSTLYVVGGQGENEETELANVFLSLNLKKPEAGWNVLATWDGPARRKAITVAQSIGNITYIYIIGGEGLYKDAEGKLQAAPLTDGYRYSLQFKDWKRLADSPQPITATPAIKYGQSHILIFGGDKVQTLSDSLNDKQLGYTHDLLVYHTITDTWLKKGEVPLPVKATEAVAYKGGIVLVSGETGASKTTPRIQFMNHDKGAKTSFGFINYTFLILYMVIMVIIGIYFSRREKGTDDYFLAGRRIPWWAAGISVLGTGLSALTYISHPAMAYSMDWFAFPAKIGILIAPIVTIYFFLPFYRRLNVTTAYEYLEKRFNLPVRLYGSAQFIIFQLVRISLILYLPGIVLSTITGINIYVCILSMGLLSTFYTVLGGIEAVIWSDVIQVIVFFAGIILAIIVVTFHVDGGVMGVIEIGMADDKYRMLYLDWDITAPVLWVVVVGNSFNSLVQYTADQGMIQRYLTTKDEKSAAKGLWLNVIIVIPVGLLFFIMGAALYAYYKTHPADLSLGMQNDAIYPLFTAQKIPIGLAGFVIAAIFSAAMSSLDSSMNSISTAFVTDFYRRFKPDKSEHQYLNIARWVTLVIGLVGTAFALVLVTYDIKSVTLFNVAIIGLLSSGLAGLFFLGVFTKRANGFGVLIGAITSAIALYFIKFYTPMNFYFYACPGFIICFVVGYLVSLVIPVKDKSLEGLTLYTMFRRDDKESEQ